MNKDIIIESQKEEMRKVGLYMTMEMYKELRAIADNSRMPLNQVILELVKRGIDASEN